MSDISGNIRHGAFFLTCPDSQSTGTCPKSTKEVAMQVWIQCRQLAELGYCGSLVCNQEGDVVRERLDAVSPILALGAVDNVTWVDVHLASRHILLDHQQPGQA